MSTPPSRLEQLKAALDAGLIDAGTYAAAIAGVSAQLTGSGALAQGAESLAVGARGVAVTGDARDVITGHQIAAAPGAQVIIAETGATVVIGEAPVAMTAVDRQSTLGRYLETLISQCRYLQLQGIRSGGKVVNIELDRIYVTLRATRHHARRTDVDWLDREVSMAPGERHRGVLERQDDTTQVTVNEALAEHRRLVVLGDPGSGKTTLLRYLALLYAQDLAEGTQLVADTLGLAVPAST